MRETKKVTKAAGTVGLATLLSRILGFVRDAVIAGLFGATMSSDAFFVAFRIPNLLRRLFAEGTLSIAFIPVFTEYLALQGQKEAFEFARSALRLLTVLLVFVCLAGMLLAPVIVFMIAPGFAEAPEKFNLTVSLTRWMFPYIICISLVALMMGILNALGHFAAPALAPVFLNVAIIGSAFLIAPHMAVPVHGLALGVLIGGVLQLTLQLPFLIRKRFYFWEKAGLFHSGLQKVGRLMLPAVFGAAVYQINILVGTLLASFLPEGSVSCLYYADRLVQFPLGLFAMAAATAVMPSFSRQAAMKNFQALQDTFVHSMNLVFFITMPAMVGMIILREPIVALLFKRGAFDLQNTQLTAVALLYYCLGLWAFSGVRIVIATFYALQDTRTPVKMGIVSVVANVVLGIILMGPLAHGGLALATSLASMLNLGLLVHALWGRIGAPRWSRIGRSVARSTVCAGLMGAAIWGGLLFFKIPIARLGTTEILVDTGGCIIFGIALYTLFSWLLKSPELKQVRFIFKGGEG
jgi:putative peptidoglycan lipid II flippase